MFEIKKKKEREREDSELPYGPRISRPVRYLTI